MYPHTLDELLKTFVQSFNKILLIVYSVPGPETAAGPSCSPQGTDLRQILTMASGQFATRTGIPGTRGVDHKVQGCD
jgi:hypothetical protein